MKLPTPLRSSGIRNIVNTNIQNTIPTGVDNAKPYARDIEQQ